MNLCLFGGTFDPIHRGHLAIARAAARRFALGQVLFAPAALPPWKQQSSVSSFWHRYAMTALALAEEGDPRFFPSDIERRLQTGRSSGKPSYTLRTLHALKKSARPQGRLFFLMGMDAFAGIARWHQAERVLRSAEIIIAGRPGFEGRDARKVIQALPPSLRPLKLSPGARTIQYKGMVLHLMPELHVDISATQIRTAVRAKSPIQLRKLVPASVAEYIRKTGLYR